MKHINDKQAVNEDLKSINLGNLKTVEFDLKLPIKGKMQTNITWQSSDDRWITNTGSVTRPAYGRGNREVTLIAKGTKGTVVRERQFAIKILQEGNNIRINNVFPIKLEEQVNQDFYLPSAVAVETSDGRVISHLVEWNDSTKQCYSELGQDTISGELKDTRYKVTAEISIIDNKILVKDELTEKMVNFGIDDVVLKKGTPFYKAQHDRLIFLLNVDNNQMLYNFRKAAGLNTKDAPEMIGWDAPNSLLKGHTTGHYLSALAKCYAATRNTEILEKLNDMVSQLAVVQETFATMPNIHSGFLSGYSEEQFDLLESYKPYPEIWAPYYTLHKILAGLLDAYEYGHNQEALLIAQRVGQWTYKRLSQLTHDQLVKMWGMYIAGEFGGMNDSLAKLTKITGDPVFVQCAKLFDNDKLMFPLLENVDALNGMHANQHIPQVIGWLEIFSVTHELKYYIAAKRFWEQVVNHHTYSIGGVGNGEMFHAPDDIAGQLSKDTAESCATYNMLKLTTLLMRYEPDVKYMNYYAHATYNHILATTADNQKGESTYFMPTSACQKREFDDENSCCHGTGLENHFMYNEGIYAKTKDALWINLLMDSVLSDGVNKMEIDTQNLKTIESIKITISHIKTPFLKIRIPVGEVVNKITLNNEVISVDIRDQVITLSAHSGDSIALEMKKQIVVIPSDQSEVFSVQYGVYVMAASAEQMMEVKLPQKQAQLKQVMLNESPNYSKIHFMPLYLVGNNPYQLYFIENS